MRNGPKRILVADDEESIRRLIDYNLKKLGFKPVLASNGQEAVALANDDLACALVDLKMPELDGLGVLDYLKKSHPDVPVIIISAVGQVKDAVEAMKRGALEYVTKPKILMNFWHSWRPPPEWVGRCRRIGSCVPP